MNCANFKDAYLNNPGVKRLCASKRAWLAITAIAIFLIATIAFNVYTELHTNEQKCAHLFNVCV